MPSRISISLEAQEALELIAKARRCSASRAAEYAILIVAKDQGKLIDQGEATQAELQYDIHGEVN